MGEVVQDLVKGILLAVLEKADVLLTELGQNLVEEVESVWLVLCVGVCADNYGDNFFEDLWLSQNLEKCFIFSEFAKNSARIKSLV